MLLWYKKENNNEVSGVRQNFQNWKMICYMWLVFHVYLINTKVINFLILSFWFFDNFKLAILKYFENADCIIL